MRIRRGGPGDADAVIALFDEAVAWMVARADGPVGLEPMSRNERWSRGCGVGGRGDGLWMATTTVAVGALVVGERPEHVHPAASPSLRRAAALSRARAGGGSGRG